MTETPAITVTRLWLIRHGEPDAEVRGRCYGRLDFGLSADGRGQLQPVAKRLASESLSAIYTSPRKRTLESAEIVAAHHACGVRIENDLREIDFGDFEGLTYDDIAKRYPELYGQWMEHPTKVEFPNGESFSKTRARVTKAVAMLLDRHAGQSVALVTHGGVIRIVLAGALSVPSANIFRIAQRYAAVNLIHFVGNHPVVELINGVLS
ncbi:alpha-ribazole phosphatase [uncultured Paludibaculum sp.]|uniref:alpha-ribazole phosphatase n=1 Tax=uncultured Paludibaculum sp. TaxID=1765020 RepID=UPI002AAAB134|nr:alpha-ribazole phosphatase [uncultured Paludibaculum sp.]